METKKIDEITSIRYVGIEPSFKIYYEMVLCAFGAFGLHHLTLKDIKGFVMHLAALVLAIIITLIGTVFVPCLVLGILLLLLLVIGAWIVPMLVAFYHYVDDDYFEAIKTKKEWPMVNRFLLLIPKVNANL
ncbi:MAG: hypothetical protein HUK21_05265 [Fibrobacteraceae bacterium]|nr:hypothetical protein [Fibrobacteraceae bacterium]